MKSQRQASEELHQLAKARHAHMRKRAWAVWYIALQAQGHLPGPPVDVVTGAIGPSGNPPDRGPCRMW